MLLFSEGRFHHSILAKMLHQSRMQNFCNLHVLYRIVWFKQKSCRLLKLCVHWMMVLQDFAWLKGKPDLHRKGEFASTLFQPYISVELHSWASRGYKASRIPWKQTIKSRHGSLYRSSVLDSSPIQHLFGQTS